MTTVKPPIKQHSQQSNATSLQTATLQAKRGGRISPCMIPIFAQSPGLCLHSSVGKLPLNWKDYLRNDENKTELFAFLPVELLSLLQDIRIVSNVGSEIKSSVSLGSLLRDISLEGLEEADGRIILHSMDIACGSARRIVIRSSDTDVLVLAVSFFHKLQKKGLKELWVLFGVGKDRRYLAAHDVASTLGEKKATALRFFHCLTRCDPVSYFASRGKRTAFSAWLTDEETGAFYKLSHPSDLPLPDDLISAVEKFIVRMYGVKDEEITSVVGARQYMFATLSRSVQAIPPTKGTLVKHILRAAYQAGQVWGRAADGTKTSSPDPWGWFLQDDKWVPVWTDDPVIWAECTALDRYDCKTNCGTQRC
ncbi:unnamed protein product [Ceutorhynchus assimilis]|uniref:Uncharacterized protein n=1 Tax=Ceutorhynchus assimilis TaxID=467358 RepID=A0A9N9QID4_9CUCU|nr:unnamed protein product [Ceutorhynchus assimilis]